VDINTAKRVAINWFTERAEKTVSDIRITKVIEEKEKGETIFYVMIFSEKGFVLIAANDIVQPILGYSTKSKYAEGNHSPAFEFYILKRFRRQIYATSQANITQPEEVATEWQRLTTGKKSFQPKNTETVGPLLTSTWDQGTYFNTQCPADPAGPDGHAYAGCVATAMAQVLNYWQHPWHGTGSHSYTPDEHPEYGVQSADFGAALYNYDNMPDVVSNYNSEVAELLYHCGVAVDMDYGPDGSGAWAWASDDVPDALKNYFRFDDFAHEIVRSSHPITWPDMMRDNLNNNWPVIYGAYDNQEDVGHAWVLDGYDAGDYFHCNWGWSGSDDGWFSIDDFSVAGYTFDWAEHACSGAYPEVQYPTGTWTLAGSPYYIDYDQVISNGSELTIEPGVEIIFNGHYNITVYGRLNASGTETDTIVFKPEDNTIGWHGLRFIDLNNNTQEISYLKYCKLEWGQAKRYFTHNYDGLYGGNIFCRNSLKLTMENCLVKCGSAYYSGGGIACFDNSNIIINNSMIRHNISTGSGGGIYTDHTSIFLDGCVLKYNESLEGYGAAMNCFTSINTIINNTNIHNNYAVSGGGFCFTNAIADLDSLIFHHNEATSAYGGAIFSNASTLNISANQIYLNSADEFGGGMYGGGGSDINVSNSIICHNIADSAAGIALLNSDVDIENSTFSENDTWFSDVAGGLYLDNSNATSLNSIFWDNGWIEIDTVNNGTLSASYSDIMGGWPGAGNVDADPLFYHPEIRDFNLTWAGYPMPDSPGKSPCIDTGDPASPLDPDGSRADMGALPYEYVYTALSGGNISGTLTCADSPYFVDGNLVIPSGDQLIIEPCVYVMFRGHYKFQIEGQLLAEGTTNDIITFACLDTITGWKGLRFHNLNYNGQDSSKLVNCRVSYGNVDDPWQENSGGGMYFYYSSKVRVENCLISKNNAIASGGGIYTIYSSPLFINNTIINNTADFGGGIYANSFITLSGGLICNNYAHIDGGGIYSNMNNSEFSGVTVRNNLATNGGGLYLSGWVVPVFDPLNRCNIYSNHSYGPGLDIFASPGQTTTIYLNADTLSVLNPTNYFFYPIDRYDFDFTNYVIEQENLDLYVSTTGSDENSGTSFSEPLKTIQMALKKIIADTLNPRTIHIANGTYSDPATGEILPLNPKDFVSLSGEDRDLTIIDGEDKSRLVYGYEDNYYTIQNMTITRGYGEEGGAIYLLQNSSPQITNVKISDSETYGNLYNGGGGLYCTSGSAPHLSYVEFYNNKAVDYGGGMMCGWYISPVLDHVDFIQNEAPTGGGIACTWECNIVLDSCNLEYNTANTGGGMYIYKCTNPVISNTEFKYNNAYYGGGIYANNSYPAFYNTQIKNNTADSWGGGVYTVYSNTEFNNSQIIGNNASGNGGGMYLSGNNDHTFYNTLVVYNEAENNGAGIYLAGGNNVEFINVTVADNTCTSGVGGALYVNNDPNPYFLNSIVWDNSPDEFYIYSGTITAEYCDIQGSWPGTGNIDADPQFEISSYGLQNGSPCINAGNPDTTGLNLPLVDLAGDPRISNDTIDMGAYEYQFPMTGIELELTVFLEGPFNGIDMDTDLNDLTILPLSQPYNTVPWNYGGTESVPSIPDVNIVDWVLVELRDAPDAASATPATTVAQQAAFLKNDGSIVVMDGISNPLFPYTPVSQLFVVIWHRNHLGIMSANALTESGGVYSYDFTTPAGQAFGTDAQKDLGGGVFGMYAGDANANGIVNLADKTLWTNQAGTQGYNSSDFDMDSQTENKDKNDNWYPNVGESCQVPE